MTIGYEPSVFVSSTCYDLSQIRRDLFEFIESLGMNPVLSEFNSFPVDPNLDAVGNCLSRVNSNADIFVLIVGGRYGSQTESGKSVTNLEYLEAKATGIPCYIFIQKAILSTLPLWRNNPAADFSSHVDSKKLFKFIDSLTAPKSGWVFGFETAQDITEILRKQFAYLFKDALEVRAKLQQPELSNLKNRLSEKCLVIIVRKPFAWEYLLFNQALKDEIAKLSSSRKDLRYRIALGTGVYLNDLDQLIRWSQEKLAQLYRFIQSAENVVNVALPEATGAPGQAGLPEEIVYAGQRLGEIYQKLITWSLDFVEARGNEKFRKVIEIIGRASRNIISEIEDFSKTLDDKLKNAIIAHESTGESQTLAFRLTMTCPNMDDLDLELKRLAERMTAPVENER
jgi:hypothetical protein